MSSGQDRSLEMLSTALELEKRVRGSMKKQFRRATTRLGERYFGC